MASNWWLSSPDFYDGSGPYAREGLVYGFIGILGNCTVNDANTFRPSINLKTSVLINGGNGTKENPYTVKLS